MKKGLIFIIIAGVLWGTSCIFVNFFAPYGFSSTQMLVARFSVAFLGLLLYCVFFNRKAFKAALGDFVLFAICGLSLLGTAAFYYESMQMTSASTAVVLMYISPIPIMLLSVLFLGESFSTKKGIAVALMLIGCAFVSGIVGDFKPDPLGILMGLLSAASYTVYNIFNKLEARRGIDPCTSTLYTFMFATAFALIIGKPWELAPLVAQEPLQIIPMFVLLGIATGLLPYLFYSMSLKHLSVGVASAMSIIEPMSCALLGFIVLREPLSFYSLLGIVLIISSVLLLGLAEGDGRKEKKALDKHSK